MLRKKTNRQTFSRSFVTFNISKRNDLINICISICQNVCPCRHTSRYCRLTGRRYSVINLANWEFRRWGRGAQIVGAERVIWASIDNAAVGWRGLARPIAGRTMWSTYQIIAKNKVDTRCLSPKRSRTQLLYCKRWRRYYEYQSENICTSVN